MNGILFLSLAIVFSSCVGMILKVANTRPPDFGQFMAVNCLVCTTGLLVGNARRTVVLNSPFIWGLGIVVGFLYVLCLWLFHQAIEAGGLALSTTLMRLFAAIPTMGSLIIFVEHTNVIQMIGIFIAFCCLPLASMEPLHLNHAWKGMAWGMLLFAAYGLTDKIQVELESSVDPSDCMLIIFGTAMLLTAGDKWLFPHCARLKRVGTSGESLWLLR